MSTREFTLLKANALPTLVADMAAINAAVPVVAADADRAEDAAEAAVAAAVTVGLYARATLAEALTAGLAAVSEGQNFYATGGDVNYIGLYKDTAGVAVEQPARLAKSSVTDAILAKIGGGNFTMIDFDPEGGSAFFVADEDGRPSFVDIDFDGNPTDQAADRIAEAIEPLLGLGTARFETIPADGGISFSLEDDQGRMSDMVIDNDGNFTPRVLDKIKDYVLQGFDEPVIIDAPPAFILPVGDSLTAGATATSEAARWRNRLTAMTGISNTSMGVGGETDATILARLGTSPMYAVPSGGQIPASGPVDLVLTAFDGGAVAPLLQGSNGINPMRWHNVEGTLSVVLGTPNVYRFSRTTAGSAIKVAAPAPMVPLAYRNYRKGYGIYGLNQNGRLSLDELVRQINNAIKWQFEPRYLVWTPTSGNDSSRATMDARFTAEWGPRFVNIRKILSSLWAFDVAGLPPTGLDETAITTGTVPPTFLSDAVHHTDLGQLVIATAFYNRGRDLGDWS